MEALEPFYLERLRAISKLDGATCPGEEICTTDLRRGIIVRDASRTLDNYCHGFETKETDTELDDLPKKFRRIYPGCKLYATKPENVPLEIAAAVDTAEDLKELNNINLLPTIDQLTAWEVCCYRVAVRAANKVDNEKYATDKANSGTTTPSGRHIKPEAGQSTAPTEGMNW